MPSANTDSKYEARRSGKVHGVFVKGSHKFCVIWNSNGGTDTFIQCEIPYDTHSSGGIEHVDNGPGGSSTMANPDVPVSAVGHA